MPGNSNDAKSRTARSKVPSCLFGAAALPADERFVAWRQSIRVMLDSWDADHDRFDAEVESYLLNDVLLARATVDAQAFDRTRLRVAQDASDHAVVQVFLKSYVAKCDVLCAIIPRRLLPPLLSVPNAQQDACVDPQGGAGQLLVNFLATLFSTAPSLTLVEASQAARTLIDLTALALNGAAVQPGSVPNVAQPADLMRVQTYIKQNLHRPDLDPETVAVAVGMSRAQLYRLFAASGGVAGYVREHRLRRCLADLIAAGQSGRRIADIAYSWGFADPAYFTKAFKQRFGRTPSDIREALTPNATTGQTPLDERMGERLYGQWTAGIG